MIDFSIENGHIALTIVIIGFVFSIFLFANFGEADIRDYNTSCTFYLKFNRTGYNFYLTGWGEYPDGLVKGNRGKAILEIMVSGNVSDLRKYIHGRMDIYCDGDVIDWENGRPDIDFPYNDESITSLTWEEKFDVPDDAKHCYARANVYGSNETWAEVSGCEQIPGADCLCRASGLTKSSVYDTDDFLVLSVEEYKIKESTEVFSEILNYLKGQAWTPYLGLFGIIAGVLIGGLITYKLSSKLNKDDFELKSKREQHIGINRISQHLASFYTMSARFENFKVKKGVGILKKDLERWKNKLENLFSEYAHLDFMAGFMFDCNYIVAQIDTIMLEYHSRDEIINILNGVGKDIQKFLKHLKNREKKRNVKT